MAARPPGAERPRAVRRARRGRRRPTLPQGGFTPPEKKRTGTPGKAEPFRGETCGRRRTPYEAHLLAGQEAEVEGERSGRTSTGRGALALWARPRRPQQAAHLPQGSCSPEEEKDGTRERRSFSGETCGRRRTPYEAHIFPGQEAEVEGERSGARPPGAERPCAVRRVQGGPQQAARLAAGRIYSARGRKGRGPRERRSLFRGRHAADVETPIRSTSSAGQEAE